MLNIQPRLAVFYEKLTPLLSNNWKVNKIIFISISLNRYY